MDNKFKQIISILFFASLCITALGARSSEKSTKDTQTETLSLTQMSRLTGESQYGSTEGGT